MDHKARMFVHDCMANVVDARTITKHVCSFKVDAGKLFLTNIYYIKIEDVYQLLNYIIIRKLIAATQ